MAKIQLDDIYVLIWIDTGFISGEDKIQEWRIVRGFVTFHTLCQFQVSLILV